MLAMTYREKSNAVAIITLCIMQHDVFAQSHTCLRFDPQSSKVDLKKNESFEVNGSQVWSHLAILYSQMQKQGYTLGFKSLPI